MTLLMCRACKRTTGSLQAKVHAVRRDIICTWCELQMQGASKALKILSQLRHLHRDSLLISQDPLQGESGRWNPL